MLHVFALLKCRCVPLYTFVAFVMTLTLMDLVRSDHFWPWGCPCLQAVCCADQQSCCPSGSSCNLVTKTCDRDLKLLSLSPGASTVWNVPCNGSFSCRTNFTCCKTASGRWGCCPFPEVKMIFTFETDIAFIITPCITYV
uniref:Granulins domain-containing protein n=1 Tax=Eptatretus burgeri TaxID=7764 RepID=A0A8C4QS16_EPTBU